MDEMTVLDEMSAKMIRDKLASELTDRLLQAYSTLLQDQDSEIKRKAAYDLADLLGLRNRAPGGSHQSNAITFGASMPVEALAGLAEGMKTLAQGSIHEFSKPPKTINSRKAIPGSEASREQETE